MESRIGLSLALRPLERLRAPRIPVHRIVGVLLQVGAGFVRPGGSLRRPAMPLPWNQPASSRMRATIPDVRNRRPQLIPDDASEPLGHCREDQRRARSEAQARRRSPHPCRPSLGLQQRGRHRRDAADAVAAGRASCAVHSDRDQFLGHAYVNPHALICARIVGRDPGSAARPLAHRASAERRARVARAAEPRAVLPSRFRRIGPAARPRARPLRRCRRRPDRHRRHGSAARRTSRPRCEKVLAPAAFFWKNDSGARELEQLPQYARSRVRRRARGDRGARSAA